MQDVPFWRTLPTSKQRPAPLERGLFCIPTHISYKCIHHLNTYININISTMPCNAQLSVLLFSVPFLSLSQFRLMSRNFLWKPYICKIWKLMYGLSQFVEAALYFAKYLLCGCDHYKLFICFARPAISVWGVSSLCDTRPRPSQFILKSLIASRRLD